MPSGATVGSLALLLLGCHTNRDETVNSGMAGGGEPQTDEGEAGDGDDTKLDVGAGETEGHDPDDPGTMTNRCHCEELEDFSYIWIANSGESTVSKVDTRTAEEVGRFYTREDKNGNPSRTSVSLGGRAVAVANRNGGVTKIFARSEYCDPDRNGTEGVQTSTNNEPFEFVLDDCIAWHAEFDYTTQRPIAWAGCEDEGLWTAGCFYNPSGDGDDWVHVHLLDGRDGSELGAVEDEGVACSEFGAYGGATDPLGNFWMSHNGGGAKLARIDRETLDYQVYAVDPQLNPYGITVDNLGRPWLSSWGGAGAGRFDPSSATWEVANGFLSQGGIQQGADGRIWVATQSSGPENPPGALALDPETLEELGRFSVYSGGVKGISLDVDGNVWAVAASAHRIDADTLEETAVYSGLNFPYTYSDMTGWGLRNASCNVPEG